MRLMLRSTSAYSPHGLKNIPCARTTKAPSHAHSSPRAIRHIPALPSDGLTQMTGQGIGPCNRRHSRHKPGRPALARICDSLRRIQTIASASPVSCPFRRRSLGATINPHLGFAARKQLTRTPASNPNRSPSFRWRGFLLDRRSRVHACHRFGTWTQ